MKTVDLKEERLDLQMWINLARKEPLMLLTADGREFVHSEADDFEQKVETLRASPVSSAFSTPDRSRPAGYAWKKPKLR